MIQKVKTAEEPPCQRRYYSCTAVVHTHAAAAAATAAVLTHVATAAAVASAFDRRCHCRHQPYAVVAS